MTTTGTLNALACDIQDYDQRRPLINLIMAAWENADDTFAGQSVTEAEYEVVAMRSLEGLLCYEEDKVVRDWFKAQGVRW